MQTRNEYPRPQLVRDNWLTLNGPWGFMIDYGNSGFDRGVQDWAPEDFDRRIQVPFCPESVLSGVNEQDFMTCVWYARSFVLPPAMRGKRILLHFEAADFETQVWCNGILVGGHLGGYTPFSFDITGLVHEDDESENRLVVRCFDDTRSGKQAVGKQSGRFFSAGCHYTRTTGIWQSVWLEAVPQLFVEKLRYTVDINAPAVTVTLFLSEYAENLPVTVETTYEGRATGSMCRSISGRICTVTVALSETHLWECGQGRLYDVKVQAGDDTVYSYFGLRDLSIDKHRLLINGKPVFQRLVLDQGFYPDGVCTAPSDEALVADISLSLAAGFNGARLHQKVFEQRFLYHADRMGYIVWGEYPSWGLDIHTPGLGLSVMLPEWLEILNRDSNHPCIVGWCPLNETNAGQDKALLYALYQATKAIDPSRPVIDASGYVHVITDVYDVHDYDQNPDSFANRYLPNALPALRDDDPNQVGYDGVIPFMVSEYGGIWWNEQALDGWGYGERVKNEADFYDRLEGLTDVLLNHPGIFGFCYTQLTDVEQEQNGIYHYDRSCKFDMARIKKIFTKKAAIEG